MKKLSILLTSFIWLITGVIIAQAPCGGFIVIDGKNIDAFPLDQNSGFSLPLWLKSGTTLAAGDRVEFISVLEFSEDPQSVGKSLVYEDVLQIGSTTATVPNGKVWKVESIVKRGYPFLAGVNPGSNSPVCVGGTLNLTASTITNATYSWAGPNGFTSVSQNPTISPVSMGATGVYTVTATVDGCSFSDTVSATIIPAPSSNFTNSFATEGLTVTFYPDETGMTSYSWVFDQGAPGTDNVENGKTTWGAAGTYDVDLTITDINGCSSTTQKQVIVNNCQANQPESDFTWTGNEGAGQTLSFTSSYGGASAYAWTFDQATTGTSIAQNPTTNWATGGTYDITLITTVSGQGCFATTKQITISNCLTNQSQSDFSWSHSGGVNPANINDNFSFSPGDLSADTYSWTFDQATPGTSTSPFPSNVNWSVGGLYDVTLITTFSGLGCYETSKTVRVWNVGVFTFTNCTQTGQNGPTQGQCDGAYAGGGLAGMVTVTGGYQQWTVPSTGTYRIEIIGAKGGGTNGGYPAEMAGDFNLTGGEVLRILVGQMGGGTSSYGAGGGGTFVQNSTSNTLLIAAGGGGAGGSGWSAGITNATTALNGRPGYNSVSGGVGASNGTSGTGGAVGSNSYGGGGGAGYSGNGANRTAQGGKSFTSTGQGGTGYSSGYPAGGFGGGGGNGWNGGGGGGGYAGGGGSGSDGYYGGGGGSYNGGTNQTNVVGTHSGHGQVVISY